MVNQPLLIYHYRATAQSVLFHITADKTGQIIPKCKTIRRFSVKKFYNIENGRLFIMYTFSAQTNFEAVNY